MCLKTSFESMNRIAMMRDINSSLISIFPRMNDHTCSCSRKQGSTPPSLYKASALLAHMFRLPLYEMLADRAVKRWRTWNEILHVQGQMNTWKCNQRCHLSCLSVLLSTQAAQVVWPFKGALYRIVHSHRLQNERLNWNICVFLSSRMKCGPVELGHLLSTVRCKL